MTPIKIGGSTRYRQSDIEVQVAGAAGNVTGPMPVTTCDVKSVAHQEEVVLGFLGRPFFKARFNLLPIQSIV